MTLTESIALRESAVAFLEDALNGLETGRLDAAWWDEAMARTPACQRQALDECREALAQERAELAEMTSSTETGDRG